MPVTLSNRNRMRLGSTISITANGLAFTAEKRSDDWMVHAIGNTKDWVYVDTLENAISKWISENA